MVTIALLLIGSIGPAPQPTAYPRLIEQLLDGSLAASTEFDWTLSHFDERNDGLTERFRTRTSGPDIWESNLGDESGYHSTRRTGEHGDQGGEGVSHEDPVREKTAGTQNRLLSQGRSWYLPVTERPLVGRTAGPEEAQQWLPTRPQGFGLMPLWISDDSNNPFRIPSAIYGQLVESSFDQRDDGPITTISANLDDGRSSLTIEFDRKVGDLPIRASLYRDGEPVFWSETRYKETSGRFTPAEVSFFKRDSERPYRSINVQRATLDDSCRAPGFGPEDIGILPGTQFYTRSGIEFWTGVDLVEPDDYWPLVYADQSFLDPRVASLLAEGSFDDVADYYESIRRSGENWRRAYKKQHGFDPWENEVSDETGSLKKTKEKDPWDEYVERFLSENKLPDAGVTRAKEVLKQAKSLRDARRKQNAAKIREAKKEGDERKIERFEEIEKSIFDRMLVKNLKRLVPEKRPDPATP